MTRCRTAAVMLTACAGLTIAGPDANETTRTKDAQRQQVSTVADRGLAINELPKSSDRQVNPNPVVGGVRGVGPANDLCANAESVTVMSGMTTTVAGTTVGATSDLGSVPEVCQDTIGTGVWYTFTGTGNTIVIDSCSINTLLDTRFSLYCGTDCTDIQCITGIAENDDAFNCTLGPINSFSSELTLASVSGQQYWLLVHETTFSPGDTEAFELNFTDDGVASGGVACGSPAVDVPCPPGATVSTEGPIADGPGQSPTVNSGCIDDPGPGAFETLACGDVVCGTFSTFFNTTDSAPNVDVDFFEITLASPMDVTLTITGEGDAQVFFNGATCASGFTAGPVAAAGTTESFTQLLPAGTSIVGARCFPPAGVNVPAGSVYVLEVSCAMPSGPANDLPENAIAVTVGSSTDGTTTGASTIDTNVPQFGDCITTTDVAGVWYSLVGTDETVTLSTLGGITNYDTKISVYEDCGGLLSPSINPCIVGNDDDPAGTIGESTVAFCSEAGLSYLIHVHGFGTAQGDFTLSVTGDATACSVDLPEAVTGGNVDVAETGPIPAAFFWPTGPEATCMNEDADTANGACAAAGEAFSLAEIPADLANFPFSWGGQNGNFLTSGGTINTRDFDGFLIDISATGLDFAGFSLDFTVESDFVADVVLLTGTCFIAGGNLENVIPGTPGSFVFEAGIGDSDAGDGIFYLLVTTNGFNRAKCGEDYTITFNSLTELLPPANDFCADAIDISGSIPTVGMSAVVSGTTVGSTTDAGFNGDDGCGTPITSPGVWYSITVPGTAGVDDLNLTLTNCPEFGGVGFDSKISVFCNGCDTPLCVAGNDDGPNCAGTESETTFDAQAGTEYLVLVHGFGGSVGAFDLVIINNGATTAADCMPPPPVTNDACADAIAVMIGDTIMGDTTTATAEVPAIADCMPADQFPGSIVSPSIWYSFSGNGNDIILTTCNQAGYDTAISVYCMGCDDGMRICVGGNDDGVDGGGVACTGFSSELVLPTQDGADYLVAVHGFAAASFGAFTLDIIDTGNASVDPVECGGMTGPMGCNPADLNDAASPSPAFPNFGIPDGLITPTDFAAFSFFFSTGDLRADINDAASPSPAFPNFGIPDGILSPTDFSAFAAYFGAGCPCTLPGCP